MTRSMTPLLLMGLFSVSMSVSCSSSDKAAPTQNTTNTSQGAPTQTATDATPTDQNAPPPANGTPPTEGRVSAIEVREKFLCPDIAELVKKDMFWEAPGGWRSYSQSFVNEIVAFVEAQWHGVNVGKVLCVYAGKEARSFPVVLQNDILVNMPTGNNWGDLKEGVVSCKSSNINDCPNYYVKRDVDIKKAYDELNFKKDQPDVLDGQ